ncbi:hypothetical protein SeMB42_g04181 [Synchytrium endobioticum]|nr:hypothetical protein SeMB42_g04181 [Synchytrium endobioticum]
MCEQTVVVYDIATGREAAVVLGIGKISCMLCTADDAAADVLVTGGEDGMLRVFMAGDGTAVAAWHSGHATRVKDMDSVVYHGRRLLVSCSSDGGVRLWDYQAAVTSASHNGKSTDGLVVEPLATYNADTRVTCVSISAVADKSRTGTRNEQDAAGDSEQEPEEGITDSELANSDDSENDDRAVSTKSKRHKPNGPRVSVILEEAGAAEHPSSSKKKRMLPQTVPQTTSKKHKHHLHSLQRHRKNSAVRSKQSK